MKQRKKKNKFTYNEFNFIGRLCNTPFKYFTRNNQLFTRFVLKTYYQQEEKLPFIMFGKDVDIACTKFQKGDLVAVKGQIYSKVVGDDKLLIELVASEMKLISKSEIQYVNEDRFLKTIELYDIKNVEKRLKR